MTITTCFPSSVKGLEPLLEILENLGPGGVLHLLCSEDRRLERSLGPHEPARLDGVGADVVPGIVSEDVYGDVVSALHSLGLESLEVSLAELESEGAYSRRSVVVDGVGVLGRAGVERTDVRSPHPSGDEPAPAKRKRRKSSAAL